MYKIRQQHRRIALALLTTAITSQVFVMHFVVRPEVVTPGGVLASVLASSALYAALVVGPLIIYEKCGWRWLNRSVDLSGWWYYEAHCKPTNTTRTARDILAPLPLVGMVQVLQTPFLIRLTSGTEVLRDKKGDQYLSAWYSTSADFVDENRLVYSFQLRVADEVLCGVEEATVICIHGRPLIMLGQFFFVDSRHRIIARGDVRYDRLNSNQAETALAQSRNNCSQSGSSCREEPAS